MKEKKERIELRTTSELKKEIEAQAKIERFGSVTAYIESLHNNHVYRLKQMVEVSSEFKNFLMFLEGFFQEMLISQKDMIYSEEALDTDEIAYLILEDVFKKVLTDIDYLLLLYTKHISKLSTVAS